VHTELGDLCDLIGDRTGALRHWQQAKALYAEMGSGELESIQKRLRKF